MGGQAPVRPVERQASMLEKSLKHLLPTLTPP